MKLLFCLVVAILPFFKLAGQVESLGKLTFSGEIIQAEDISAISTVGANAQTLLIASDEGTSLQLLRRSGTINQFAVEPPRNHVLFQSEIELDAEGIARDGDVFYIIGSHSLKRRLLDPDLTAQENRKRLEEVAFEPSRLNLFRVTLGPSGEITDKKNINLASLIARDPILGRFAQIPGKENGVDIEGIAINRKEDPKLYLGFRSPVMRENLTPVLVLRFENPTDYEVRFVPLRGLGIREIQKVNKGFLLIAGASSGALSQFFAYYWDGDDGLPDQGKIKSKVKLLGEIPTPPGAKAEGMTVVSETAEAYEVIIVFDGVANGAPERFRIQKKGQGSDEPAYSKETDE